jgi:type II secretory pathway component HofQ
MTQRFVVLAAAVVLLVPVVGSAQAQLTAQEQQMIDRQLAAPKLDPNVIVTLDLPVAPLKDVVATVAQAGDVTVRYHSGITDGAAIGAVKLSNATLVDALTMVLASKGLAFKATGAKSVFIYPGTPENREKYTESVRTFAVVNVDASTVGQILNRSLAGSLLSPDDLRPAIVTSAATHSIIVRATADAMAKIAKIIADSDKR